MIVGIILIQAVTFAILSGIVASNRNRDPAGWGVIGLLFGLFGFIAAVAVGEGEETQSSSDQNSQPSGDGEFDPDNHEKKCLMCAEYIKLEARRCKHCGHEFSKQEVERQIEEVKQKIVEKRPPEPKEKKDPSELETPPPDEIAARCGDCHYPLRSGQRRCPKCQKEVVWS
ncbi:putative Zn-ribbon and HTH transcriptional regulator [Salinibacter ruber]|uniref:zinc ribbon domain-containing protein n=1 Tax=Salinibacter ruber TaxID=146919 RepID=UPI002169C1F4|nr:zinc ribbon domain-containing protein [Salinibacter ruber]MCS4139515.1 putative Zn-ribbon and HTH transcriptional regulator [Salinibacter ruber]